jgi:hypothetical protein
LKDSLDLTVYETWIKKTWKDVFSILYVIS